MNAITSVIGGGGMSLYSKITKVFLSNSDFKNFDTDTSLNSLLLKNMTVDTCFVNKGCISYFFKCSLIQQCLCKWNEQHLEQGTLGLLWDREARRLYFASRNPSDLWIGSTSAVPLAQQYLH